MGEYVQVRRAVEADLGHIQRIYNDAIRDTTATWDEAPWPWEQRKAWWREHAADPTTPVLVATLPGGEVAGFAYLSWYRPKSGYRFTREDTVYVDPSWHGRGIGRRLLAALVDEACALGLHVLIASIEATNEASLRLHTALGFELVGTEREVGFKFGRWLDATFMQLRVPVSREG